MSSNMFLTILLFIFASAWGQDGVAQAWPANGAAELWSPSDLQDNVDDVPSDYLVGSHYAKEGQFPYQVSLQISVNKFPFCGGSILTSVWILTAAHCLTNVRNRDIEILAGSIDTASPQVRRKVAKRFNVGNFRNLTDDIALLKLESSLPTNNSRIRPVGLPKRDTSAGTNAVVTGWGYNETGRNPQTHLKYLVTRTISNNQCLTAIPKVPISGVNICARTKAGEGFCQGDSGGPLVDLWSYDSGRTFQIGIVSANIPCAKGRPDIYTRVFPFVQAIKNIIARN